MSGTAPAGRAASDRSAPERVPFGSERRAGLKRGRSPDDHPIMADLGTTRGAVRAILRSAAVAGAAGLLLGMPMTPMTSWAADSPPPASPSATSSLSGAASSGSDEDAVGAPTEKDLQAQREYLRRLRQDVAEHSDVLIKAMADQAAASAAAATALEQFSVADRALSVAQAEENKQRDALLRAQLDLAAQKAALGRWARAAYRQGQAGTDYGAMLTILSSGPTDDLSNTLASLNRIGRSRSRTVELYAGAQDEQATATEAAAAATQRAVAASAAASEAKATRDAALEEQHAAVIVLNEQLSMAKGKEVAAEKQLDVMQQAADRAVRFTGDAGTGTVGDCPGSDLSSYANGDIPIEALCPVWGAPGQHLRADAAYAFGQLSQAYASVFGTPICVTDSYRTYDEQIDLYRRKPNLAAHPGTSNHGWGTATDLCGGIQSFATAQHQWMVVNAPAFGWFHPSWARQGGSRPEPWHFEYGG